MKKIFSRPIFMKIKQYAVLFGKRMMETPTQKQNKGERPCQFALDRKMIVCSCLAVLMFFVFFPLLYMRLPQWRIVVVVLYIVSAILYCTVKYNAYKGILSRKRLLFEVTFTVAYIVIIMVNTYFHRNDSDYGVDFIASRVTAVLFAIMTEAL